MGLQIPIYVQRQVRELRQGNSELKAQNEQLRTQLAGCLAAADGEIADVAKQGDYGWSVAYQAVLDLRLAYEELKISVT